MNLHTLRPKTRNKKIKRIGRGGKRGTYSGRGQKGQKARAGHKIRPAQREALLRIPKRRGFKNKTKSDKTAILTIGQIAKIKEKIINLAIVKKYGFVSRMDKTAKVLGGGDLSTAKEIVGISCSKSARETIIKAGGTIK